MNIYIPLSVIPNLKNWVLSMSIPVSVQPIVSHFFGVEAKGSLNTHSFFNHLRYILRTKP